MQVIAVGIARNVRKRAKMHSFVFRSLELISEQTTQSWFGTVCLDLDKAEKKLKPIRRRLQGVQEQAAAQVQPLAAADAKLLRRSLPLYSGADRPESATGNGSPATQDGSGGKRQKAARFTPGRPYRTN